MKNFFVEYENSICLITLNQPQKHNAFNETFIEELTVFLKQINEDETVRVVILKAMGESFSAGADLKWMKSMAGFTHEENFHDALALANLLDSLNKLSKPTIALVQGSAFGGGVGLLACCDIVLACEKAFFCFSEVKIGLIPAIISPFVINAIGNRASRRYFLTGEHFSAQKALTLGLVSEVVAEETLLMRGLEIANMLLSSSPKAVTAAKELISYANPGDINEPLLVEVSKRIADIRVSKEGQEGLSAFLEKRKPHWVLE